MKIQWMTTFIAALALGTAPVMMTGCEDDDVDDAVDEVEDAVDDGVDKIEEGVEEVEDEIDDATTE